MGKKVNDYFKIDVDGEDVKFKIISIDRITAKTPKCERKSL